MLYKYFNYNNWFTLVAFCRQGSGWTFLLQPVVCGSCFRKAAVYLVHRTAALKICALAFWADIFGKLWLDHRCYHWVAPNFLGAASCCLLCLNSWINAKYQLLPFLRHPACSGSGCPFNLAQHHCAAYASLFLRLLREWSDVPLVWKR